MLIGKFMFSPKNLHGHSNGTFKFVFAFVFNLLVLSSGTPPTNKGAHEHRDEMYEKQQQRQGGKPWEIHRLNEAELADWRNHLNHQKQSQAIGELLESPQPRSSAAGARTWAELDNGEILTENEKQAFRNHLVQQKLSQQWQMQHPASEIESADLAAYHQHPTAEPAAEILHNHPHTQHVTSTGGAIENQQLLLNRLLNRRKAPKVRISKPAADNGRHVYRSFWDKFSDRADTSSMMLNSNADELEDLDRLDILSSLPNVAGKDVVDVGAGIGRFTGVFAKYAKTVVSSDFIASFIEKNRERNSEFTNIEYHVSDALSLNLAPMCTDLVFSNWLLMYLSDNEAIQFVERALNWLRPGGHMHIRESCSEPSTKKSSNSGGADSSSNTSLHQANVVNPTQYRFSSAYIQLFKNIHIFDKETNQWWGFSIKWACSVPVYIDKLLNWRQIHWLLEKVPLPPDSPLIRDSNADLHKLFSVDWPAEQLKWESHQSESHQSNEPSSQEIFEHILPPKLINSGSTIFSYTSPNSPINLRIDPHFLSGYYNSRIWNVEWNPFQYRLALAKANQLEDRRIRLAYSENLENALDYWRESRSSNDNTTFDLIFGVGLLNELKTEEQVKKLTDILHSGANMLSLEAKPKQETSSSAGEYEAGLARLRDSSFHINSITNVTHLITQTKAYSPGDQDKEIEWFVLKAELLIRSAEAA